MTDTTDDLTLGAAQVAEVHLDLEATLEKDVEYIREAGDLGVDLLAFPEFHLPSRPTWQRFMDVPPDEYYRDLFTEAVTIPGPTIERFQEEAADAEVAVVVGVNEKEPETAGTMYNTLVFIDSDGSLLGSRRKLVPTKDERLFHDGGTGKDVRTIDSSVGTVGGLVCGEHLNQLAKFAMIAQGAELHVGAWPAFPYYDHEGRQAIFGSAMREHAAAGCLPTIMCSGVLTDELAESVGIEDMSRDSGMSAIIGPDGRYLAGPKRKGEGIVHATVDMGERTRRKATHDIVGHYNRFDIFTLEIDRSSQEPLKFT